MDIDRSTEELKGAIWSAQNTATRYGHQQIDVEHVLASLREQEGGLAGSILAKGGINIKGLGRRLQSQL